MIYRGVFVTLLLSSAVVLAQPGTSAPAATTLQAPTTLPISFTNSVSASAAHVGDLVPAKTVQQAHLPNGAVIPAGTRIIGHVVAARGFVYDKAPYARQKESDLSIKFDSIELGGKTLPLNVTVRAMADPLSSWAARVPGPSDFDPYATVTQIGGDQLVPSQSEVRNQSGDVVAYNKRGGVYAHLISNGHCDGSDVEVSVGIYSASACGLYGFAEVSATEFGSPTAPSTITLVSSRISPKIWKNSTALLEVLPAEHTVASR
jgi:hypothetical protein